MSEDSPFGDFSEAQPQADEQPIALPPPTEGEGETETSTTGGDDVDFGLSSAPTSTDSDPFATVDADGSASSNAASFDSFSNQSPQVQEEEAEALIAWEKERAGILRERASKAEADKQAALTAAREEVSKFYSDRDATLAKQQKTNRADEKNYRTDMKATFESGAKWEKVGKLINTQPKANEKAGTSRVDRMRKLLIQLKTEKK